MTKIYILNGLDCAHCAQKINDKINALEDVKQAQLNFATKTLKISANSEKTFEMAKKIVTQIEPDVKVKDFSSNEEEEKISLVDLFVDIIGILLFAVTYIINLGDTVSLVFAIAAYLLIGHKIIINLIKKIKRFDFFDENFLMVVASVGAMIIGERLEGIAVMLFFQLGEFAQQKAVDSSRKSIKSLMAIKPDTARVVKDGFEASYPPEEIKVGTIIKVLPGEKIALEGTVVSGSSAVDKSAITGESLPEEIKVGDEVISGSINLNSVITIKVTKPFAESTVAKILDLVENANEKKAKQENFITKFAKVYTPIVVGIALLLGVIGSLLSDDVADFSYRALAFLVVSCPCALVLSIPLCYFCGIGAGARHGVLIKGGNYLEALTETQAVVFDKTGTLTSGKFIVGSCLCENGFEKSQVLEYAAAAESGSSHPIAKSISQSADFEKEKLGDITEIAANGVMAVYKGKTVLVGSKRLLENKGIKFALCEKNCVYIAIDGVFAGIILIEDDIKENSFKTITSLKKLGLEKIAMLTGDNKIAAKSVAKKLEIDDFKAECLPQQKAEYIENLSKSNKTVFVGDGINDSPVIALSDVGVAMGAAGSDSAIEAADIVLMNDDLFSLLYLFKLAKKVKRIVKQNIVFCLGVKVLIMILSAIGVKGIMWAAVFADVGVAILAVLNSMRLINFSLHKDKSVLK